MRLEFFLRSSARALHVSELDPKSTIARLTRKLLRLKKSYIECEEFFKKWNKLRNLLYETPEYRDFLREVRERAGYRCERCPSTGRGEVHHKIRVYDDPDLAIDNDNGEYLCKTCHNKEHGKTNGSRRAKPRRRSPRKRQGKP